MAPLLRLRPIAGGERGQELRFAGPRVRIGRSRDNDLVLPDRAEPASSGRHADAVLDADGIWSIIDAGSTNGTRVNGIPVQQQRLKTGDRLAFGDEQFIVSIGATTPTQPLGGAFVVLSLLAVASLALLVIRQSRPQTFEAVASSTARSVYVIAIEAGGQRRILGSGYAVRADGWLATNAHIVEALQRRQAIPPNQRGERALAIQGDTYTAHPIVEARIDSAWKASSLAHDVALVRMTGTTTPLKLADAQSIAALARGTPIAAFGFPAVSTDPARPRGRLSVDVVGDVRGDYLEVGLGISPGMSGSPVLVRSGEVVAMVVGGDFVEMPDGTTRLSGSAANWAISATLVRALVDSLR